MCEFEQAGRRQCEGQQPPTRLSPQLVKHAAGYMVDISQVNTHSNTGSGRFQGNVKGRDRKEMGEKPQPSWEKNWSAISFPLFLSVGNRRPIESRISRPLLTPSAWLPTNWNTITVKPHTQKHTGTQWYEPGMTHTSAVYVCTPTHCTRRRELIIFHSLPPLVSTVRRQPSFILPLLFNVGSNLFFIFFYPLGQEGTRDGVAVICFTRQSHFDMWRAMTPLPRDEARLICDPLCLAAVLPFDLRTSGPRSAPGWEGSHINVASQFYSLGQRWFLQGIQSNVPSEN